MIFWGKNFFFQKNFRLLFGPVFDYMWGHLIWDSFICGLLCRCFWWGDVCTFRLSFSLVFFFQFLRFLLQKQCFFFLLFFLVVAFRCCVVVFSRFGARFLWLAPDWGWGYQCVSELWVLLVLFFLFLYVFFAKFRCYKCAFVHVWLPGLGFLAWPFWFLFSLDLVLFVFDWAF